MVPSQIFFAMKFDSMEQEFMKSKFPQKKRLPGSQVQSAPKQQAAFIGLLYFFTLYPESS